MKPARFLLFAAVLAIAACSSDSDKKKDADKTEEPKKAEAPTPICPQVAIVRALETLRDYGHEKPDPKELVAAARMLNVQGNCAYLPNGIDIKFKLNMQAFRGPRLGGLHTGFPFFVAVVDPDGAVLNKNQLTVDFGFSSEDPLANDEENLHVFIPLAKAAQSAGPNYQVLTGFQLTEEQLDDAAKMKAAGK